MRLYNGVRLIESGICPENVYRLDAGALPMIAFMQRTGLQVDLTHFASMDKVLTEDMDRLTEEVQSLTGYYCNLGSGDQVSDLLFKKLGIKQARVKMTKSGDRESVEDEVLTAIQHEHPVVPLCLEYKEIEKLRGTYVRPMPKLAKRVGPHNWRIFPNFRTTRVPSGRLACSDPNLLAMPTRTSRGKEIRKGFITATGWKYLSVDESQIEPRIAAHRSKDPGFLRIYQQQEDIYSDFATRAFRLQDKRYRSESGKWIYPTVDDMEHRRPSKTCVLAALYDVTAPGLLEQMPVICQGCRKEATKHTCGKFKPIWQEGNCQDLLNNFYMEYSGILRMRKIDHSKAIRDAYTTDMFGRVLHVAAVRSILEWVRSAALREVGNFPMQSSAQGTIKLTMAATWDDLVMANLLDECHPLLQVHDELLYEVREDLIEDIAQLTAYRFETCVPLAVPIKTGTAVADSWGTLPK